MKDLQPNQQTDDRPIWIVTKGGVRHSGPMLRSVAETAAAKLRDALQEACTEGAIPPKVEVKQTILG